MTFKIYLQKIEETLQNKKQILILFPEIFSVQIWKNRFEGVLPESCTLYHPGLAPKTLRETENFIAHGTAKVILATRGGLFLNFKNLDTIIVHDEHDSSYKQENHLRYHVNYHAVDVAVYLAETQKIKLFLSSKSPRLETKLNYSKYLINQSVSSPQQVDLVDLKKEEGGNRLFSKPLQEAVKKTLQQQKQIILFHNRRGLARALVCLDCHTRFSCPNCSVALVLHQNDILKCHACLFEMPSPSQCPKCQSPKLKKQGAGTEKIEKELKRFFKDVKILRLDKDVVTKKSLEKKILDQFNQGEAQILLGTQMLLKEYDFKNVGLVAVLNADTDLYLPDFRSNEKTFARLTDLIDLAGSSAQVVIQTYQIDQRAIQLAVKGDYETFYEEELVQRKALDFPPYTSLIKIVAKHKEESKAHQLAQSILEFVSAKQILGPVEAPMAKLKGKFRVMIILKNGKVNLQKIPSKLLKEIEIDVDPQNLL
jgi:primosomal protein N' (replication factor Y)